MTSDFVLRLGPEPHIQDGVGALRGLLEEGLRTYGLRPISAQEIAVEEPGLGVWEACRRHRAAATARMAIVLNREGAEIDLPEATTREIWEVAATS